MTRPGQPLPARKENLEQRIVLDATAEFVFDFSTEVGVNESVIVGDVVYFPADDGTGDVELWKSDGSVDGTTRVKDIREGRKPSIPQQLTPANGSVYFTAYDDQFGREVWVSDGSETGTRRLTDTDVDLRFEALAETGDLVFFAVWRTDVGQTQIWQSDGTAAGTMVLTTVDSPIGQIYPVDALDSELGGLLLGGESGLWFVNLDDRSTMQLFASGSVRVTNIFELGEDLFIRVQERWLRRIDLDAMKTEQVFDSRASRLIGPIEYQGDVVYALLYVPNAPPTATATQGTLRVLRSSDLTGDATEILHVGSGMRRFRMYTNGDKLFFDIQQNNGRQLWTSDGTADGTAKFFESSDINFGETEVIGSDLYIEASNSQEDDFRIWRINGSDLTRSEVVVGSNTSFIGALNDRLLFRDGPALMTTDGTQEGTTPLTENLPVLNSRSGLPFNENERDVLTTVGDGLLIKTGYPPSLYQTNGAIGEIAKVETPGMVHGNIGTINTTGDLAFFLDGSSNLWAVNVATGELRHIQPPDVSEWDVDRLPVAGPTEGSVVYFQAESDPGGNGNLATHIWVSDGTNEGTRPVLELDATVSGHGRNIFLWNDSVLFHTEDQDLKLFDGSEVRTLFSDIPLWQFQFYPGDSFFYFAHDGEFIASDGTVEGTSSIGSGPTQERNGEVFGDRLYFIGDDAGIWMSDGTPESTRPVIEDPEFNARSLVGRLGDDLYIASEDDTLWKTDGTPSGTKKVADVRVDTWIHSTAVPANGHLYFNASSDGSQFNDTELWRTDGTTEGTVQVSDIAPGSMAGSNPKYLTKVNGFLYFGANDGFRGNELWRYPIDPVPGDADGNGTVNFVDFLRLSANFGLTEEALHSEGDFNFDGAINFEDFLLLSANFGEHRSNGVHGE